jgi:hypothetical protein
MGAGRCVPGNYVKRLRHIWPLPDSSLILLVVLTLVKLLVAIRRTNLSVPKLSNGYPGSDPDHAESVGGSIKI